ncbi:MAG: hypothetical protein AAGH89_19385 [Verrucomicrobiota bacterium]
MKWEGLVIVGGVLCLPLTGFAQERKFTSNDGKTIEATLIDTQPEQVQLKLPEGRKVWVPRSRFDEASIKYIEEWESSPSMRAKAVLGDRLPKLGISVVNGGSQKRDDKEAGYVDERKRNIHFRVSILNEERGFKLENAKATLFIHGESMNTGRNVVVHKKVWDNLTLDFQQKRDLDAGAFELWYDDRGAVYGFKYDGYFLIVQDMEGKVIATKSIPSSAAKYAEQILKFGEGSAFDRSYRSSTTESLSQAKR